MKFSEIFDFFLGNKSRTALFCALVALSLALWWLWGQNKALGCDLGAATAAGAAQAESIKTLVADKEALNLALQKREKEIEKIRADFGAKMALLGDLERDDPELAGWGALPLPRGLAGLRRRAGDNANGGDSAHSAGGPAARLPKAGRGAGD